jgi:histidinol-phosphate aminotransferase
VTVRFSSSLHDLPLYVPGRDVVGTTKLASNETPYPPLPHVVARILESAQNANRYPDTAAVELCERLATKLAVGTDQVAVSCGSMSLCAQLVRATTDPGEEVIYAWRSFEGYPIAVALNGGTSVRVPLSNFGLDLAAIASAVTDRTKLIFICNPNNPTGTVVTTTALKAFLAQVPDNVLVVLDEAYYEFVRDPSTPDGVTLLAEHPNVVVLRTFSKAYGLAGLRVGYAVSADPEVISAVRRTQLPFVVAQVAQDAAVASLEPEAESQLHDRVLELVNERARVRDCLIELGYEVPPSQANFVWLPLAERSAEWAAGCASRKLIVRPLGTDGVRVTVGSPAQNDRLLEAARELVAN